MTRLYIRTSLGTAMALGLKSGMNPHPPTTAYIMLGQRCRNNCKFCEQARDNKKNNRLSRIIWPRTKTRQMFNALKEREDAFTRVCVQCLDYPELIDDLVVLAQKMRQSKINLPLTASVTPMSTGELEELRESGYQKVSIALDAANEEIFDMVKGHLAGNNFSFLTHLLAIERAQRVFGYTFTHIIVGLGESDRDITGVMYWLKKRNIGTALFAFTKPLTGQSNMVEAEPPDYYRYRAVQIARALIYEEDAKPSTFEFDENGMIDHINVEPTVIAKKIKAKSLSNPFMTSGCPGCNRPYYNERPNGQMYNYPYSPEMKVTEKILKEMRNKGIL